MNATDALFIRRLAVDTIIGVLDWEREQTQTLFLSLTLHLDSRAAAASERVQDTVDYTAVAAAVREHLQANSYQLIETLANRVSEILLATFSQLDSVSLSVEKPDVVPGTESVGIRVHRARS